MFKTTNKTVRALTGIGRPAQNYEDYKTLVENLYFLTHESVGARLGGSIPQSFSDVISLRTDLQHDLDHGPQGKARRKRKAVAGVFRKYAGAGTPTTLDPGKFVVVQANLLRAIGIDIERVGSE